MADNETGAGAQGNEAAGTDAGAANGKAKPKTEYTTVTMKDGREVKFAGKRKVIKEVIMAEGGQAVSVRFDFLNGETRSLTSGELAMETALQLLGHGIAQKVGDESAGVEKVEDIVLGTDNMIDRLKKGEFYTERAAGDSFAGGSLVIKAIVEATGKTVEDVKKFLDGKLEAAKAKGEKLTRADLYASFRNPTSKTGAIIERLEREERSKATKVNADDLLLEVGAA